MRVLLVSTYELGHQPLHLASAAASLKEAGHDVRTVDISVEPWDPAAVDWAHAVAFSVPMHTAMRLAMKGAEAVKARRADVPVCFFGLYANVSRDLQLADYIVAGEYESSLAEWADSIAEDRPPPVAGIELSRQRQRLPVREGLPRLKKYAHLALGGEERLVGYVEASRGCVHRCRHCPVPVVYDGRTRKVAADVVLDDIAQLVDKGAEHITFGDPDFLNRWAHSMKIVELTHQRFPKLTFDMTTKVSHLIRYKSLIPLLAEQGCLFAVSAYECLNDDILGYLDKGHTRADAELATMLLRDSGIEPRPSWLPFMPWTTVEDVADTLDFVVRHDLVGNVDPVQYTIRLLIPEGSLMLGIPELEPYLGPYDAENLTYTWSAADERTVALQRRLAELVEREQGEGKSITEIFCDVRDVVYEAAGRSPQELVLAGSTEGRPRLTEPWFC